MVGENAARYPQLLARIREEGHGVGNHTHHHSRGCKSSTSAYLRDVEQANCVLQTPLFRPPHGRMKYSQKKALHQAGYTIYLWDVLPHDYNARYSAEDLLSVVKQFTRNGSIITLHDSLKSKERMLQALPFIIQHLKDRGMEFRLLGTDK